VDSPGGSYRIAEASAHGRRWPWIIINHSDNRSAMLANQVANFASDSANHVAICASLLKLGIEYAIVVG